MAEKELGPKGGKDWSNASEILRKRSEKSGTGIPQPAIQQHSHPAVVPVAPSRVPVEITIPSPDFSAEKGFYQLWTERKMKRKQLVAHLAELHKGHMELLKEQVKAAVKVGMIGIATRTKIVLEEMDKEYLEGMAELKIQNAAVRVEAVSKLNDMICVKIKEVEAKQWPQELMNQTINDAFALQERVRNEIMMELGNQCSNDD